MNAIYIVSVEQSGNKYLLQHGDRNVLPPGGVVAGTAQVHVSHTVALGVGGRAQRQGPQGPRR
jgi:hypothetical protein